jgi:ATP phosphoribosyltransferase regulatory subunit
VDSVFRSQPWQLPDGMDELAPQAAHKVEQLRRRLLDHAARWGYELVMPPLAEFTDSLLVGVGEDLDLLTFKAPDQLSGRMLGIRADITPQVARMDAHSLRDRPINRLCYAGSTLHTRARSLLASRSPLQLGAELYGDDSLAADIEVIDLMLGMLREAGIAIDGQLTLDLGHSSVFSHVLAACGTEDAELDRQLFDALQRKSRPDLEALMAELPAPAGALLEALLELHGDLAVLDEAERQLAPQVPALQGALDQLRQLATAIGTRHPELGIYIDLGELRGYRYHTGVVFAAYCAGLGEALAQGGRYDNVGAVYGRARPATGFATDLRLLASQLEDAAVPHRAVAAPALDDPALQQQIAALRAAGETVIVSLGGAADARCDRELVLEDGQWQLRPRDGAAGDGDEA